MAYREAVQGDQAGPLPRSARRYRYLFVPGINWDSLPNYFKPNIRRLRHLGLKASFVKTEPIGSSQVNASIIRKAISRSEMPVVLIGHSKGALDAMQALVLFPKLQNRVSRLVALQAPYRGTAVADWFLSHPLIRNSAIALMRLLKPLRLWGPSPDLQGVLESLSLERRQALESLPLRKGIRLFSLVTRVSEETQARLLMRLTAAAVRTLGGRDSDGVVVPEQAVLPGSRYALLEHAGHIDTVADPSNWKHRTFAVRGHDPDFAADLTEALVRWIFSR